MNKTALAIRHVANEDLGLLAPVLADFGYTATYLDTPTTSFTAADLLTPDLLIVLGGPIGVGDTDAYPFLERELAGLKLRCAKQLPTLGFCLGAQLIAAALGGEVRPSGGVEIGYQPVSLTPAGKKSILKELAAQPVLHWHGDNLYLPEQYPAGTISRLAATELCPNQAFSVDNWALGLQFHLEVPPTQLESWLVAGAFELAHHQLDPAVLRQQRAEFGPQLETLGTQVFTRWLQQLP